MTALSARSLLLITLLTTGFTGNRPELSRAPMQSSTALPVVEANDNRKAGGVLRSDTLKIDLVVQMARWYPEAADGPSVELAVFTEAGKAPQIPAPLIRVTTGTTIVATVLNSLPDSVLWIRGLMTHPAAPDSASIKPGEFHTFVFAAGAPGTYLYTATPGHILRDERVNEREQLSGGFVVDPVGGRTDDRILVINIWGTAVDSTKYRNALAINGKSWPYTERISASVGDSVRWRVVNGSARRHPMHMHGFYFRVDSRGTFASDTTYPPDARRLVVTEDMATNTTMSMVWSPDRPGNWLFHCHLTFHVIGGARLDGPEDDHVKHEADPAKHMAGLVIGMQVKPRAGAKAVAEMDWKRSRNVRRLHLFANERPRKGHTPYAMSYVLQRDSRRPVADSVELPGQPIVLTRGEPTEITVVNRTREGTSVHWHGIELESYSDGVAGWSGVMQRLAPMVAPNDSFKARLTLPRSGTFIYHTHLNDIEQVTSGMYGPILVLEPGEKFDRSRDHVFTIGWDGVGGSPNIVINGDSILAPLEIEYGKTHRFRFVNIGPATRFTIAMRRDSIPVSWRPRAKDGADLPPAGRKPGPAITALNVGETFDAEFDPPARGEYRLTIGPPAAQALRTRRIIVR